MSVTDNLIANSVNLCSRAEPTCALQLFCDCDLEVNPMILKLESDLDILKMYLHIENKAGSLN